jgi:hypothetical protein
MKSNDGFGDGKGLGDHNCNTPGRGFDNGDGHGDDDVQILSIKLYNDKWLGRNEDAVCCGNGFGLGNCHGFGYGGMPGYCGIPGHDGLNFSSDQLGSGQGSYDGDGRGYGCGYMTNDFFGFPFMNLEE